MSLFDLTGKVALITGSSRGIGKATAIAMAEQGAKVVISSRKQDACDEAAKEINDRFGEGTAIAVAANISSKEALHNLVAETRNTFGKIDVLVCNAASNPYYGPALDMDDAAFLKILQNNILSNHWLIQAVAPEMKERNDGAIIIVASIGGMLGTKHIGGYNISKAADFQLVRNMAVELGPWNIRVNAIAPGIIRTDFAKALYEDPAREAAIKKATPLGRIGEPEDIAGAAVYFASAAGAHTTGQSIVIDGGTIITGDGL